MVVTTDQDDAREKFDGTFGMGLSAHFSWLQNAPEPPMSNVFLQPRNAFSFYVYIYKKRKSGYGGEVSRPRKVFKKALFRVSRTKIPAHTWRF